MSNTYMKINFFNTFIDPSAKELVNEVLSTTFLSEGALVKKFEENLSQLGIQNPVALNSGTSALRLALALAHVGPGNEVIIPAQTFVGTGTAILEQGAKPVFADIDYATGNISPESIRAKITSKTKAIIPVHWGGLPVDLDEILSIAREHNLTVIEDAAHALGATYKNQIIGGISPLTCFSFQAIKHVTTGDGGAVATTDATVGERAKVLRWFGINRAHSHASELGEREYDITESGFKYHLNDYGAALGIANLKTFTERLTARRAIAALYRKGLANVPGITLFAAPKDREGSYWLFGFHVERRDDFIRALKTAGIPTSVVHRGVDHNSIFGGKDGSLINQRRFDETQIHIPIHDAIGQEEANYIISTIKKGW